MKGRQTGIVSENLYLLDTSAWFTLMEDEEGADEVEKILRNGRILLPFIVLLEVYYISFREKGEEAAYKRYALLMSLGTEVIWEIDEPTLFIAGRFKSNFKISLADAIIASMAKRNGAILVHKDPEYIALDVEVRQIALQYKESTKSKK